MRRGGRRCTPQRYANSSFDSLDPTPCAKEILTRTSDVQIIDVTKNPSLQYKVHYHGWNAKWDEWVTVKRLLPFTAPNERKKSAMDREAEKPSGTPKRGTSSRNASDKQSGPSSKRQKVNDKKDEEDDVSKVMMKLRVPFNLKKQLVVDWEVRSFARLAPHGARHLCSSTIHYILAEHTHASPCSTSALAFRCGCFGILCCPRKAQIAYAHREKGDEILSRRHSTIFQRRSSSLPLVQI